MLFTQPHVFYPAIARSRAARRSARSWSVSPLRPLSSPGKGGRLSGRHDAPRRTR